MSTLAHGGYVDEAIKADPSHQHSTGSRQATVSWALPNGATTDFCNVLYW